MEHISEAITEIQRPVRPDQSPTSQKSLSQNSVDDENTALRAHGWYRIYLQATWDGVDCREALEAYRKTKYSRGIFMTGDIGVGKTSLMALFARDIVRMKARGIDGVEDRVFQAVPDFVSMGMLFDLYFERKYDQVDKYMKAQYLFLDDIGTEYASDFPLAKFGNFIEYRYGNILPTFITSNTSLDDLRKRSGFERIADRINDPKWMTHFVYAGKTKRVR